MDKNNKSPLSRRRLFKDGANYLGQLTGEILGAIEDAQSLAEEEQYEGNPLEPSRGLFRPPGAVQEYEFRLLCERNHDCIKACPEEVLFKAPPSYGDDAGAPTFNPSVKSCFVCSELHCIKACKSGALEMPESVSKLTMGVARIDPSLCLAHSDESCRFCVDVCPLPISAVALLGDIPVIRAMDCVGCGMCEEACFKRTKRRAIITLARLA